MTRRYTGGFLSATEQVTDANTANGIFSVQDAGALTAAGLFPTGRWTPQRSIRFRRANKGYFNRTPGTAGNRRTWTWSAWVKQTNLTNGAQPYFTASNDYVNGTYSTTIYYNGSSFKTRSYEASTEIFALETTAQYRDPSAWYHLVISVDTTHAIQSQRVKMYVNGIQQTDFVQALYPSTANYDTYVNSTAPHRIGSYPYGAGFDDQYYMDGYMSEYNLIDGQALTPYAFGMTDPETGTWVPKRYTGSYGTNGFYLDFRDNSASTAAAIGADRSGNGNNWTPNLISLSGVTSTTTSYTTVGSTTFTPPANVSSVRYLVVAGGGAGGSAGPNMYDGGAAGGGAGGMLQGTLAVTPGTPYTVTVGGAGTGASNRTRGASGSNSVFDSFTAIGGGGGGGGANTTSGANGGSGGGGANGGAAGLGTAGQGNNGGFYVGSPGNGGGGAGGIGGSASNNTGAAGGTGATSDVSGSTVTYAGGGGGGGYQLSGGSGGSSIGGAGGNNNANGSNASSYGSGGGGSGGTYNTSGTLTGGNGSQGIVIISYSVPDSTYDSMVDVPGIASTSSQTDFGGVTRGNYATLNPLNKSTGGGTLSEANLRWTTSGGNHTVCSSMAFPSSGKWYFEATDTVTGGNSTVGIFQQNQSLETNVISANINMKYNGMADNATFGFAVDMDNLTYTWYKNGVVASTGSASTGSLAVDVTYVAFSMTSSGAGSSVTFNFGQRPFKYAPPTGHKSLCTTNLPNPVIKRPSDHFDVKTWTGNGTGLTVGTTVKQSSAYAINKSLRFRKANSAYLSRTPSTTGNQKTWTWSGWVKQSLFGTSGTQWILTSGNSGSISTNYTILSFSVNGFLGNANEFQFYSTLSNSTVCAFESSQKFADSTQWCNVVLAVDTTQVNSVNRVKLYVDGVQITSFATATYPGLSVDIPFINSSSYETRIGGIVTYGSFDGYMTEINFVDGQALTPSSFGAYDANNNWMPQRYAGTYGTQGYYLPFNDNTSTTTLGYDRQLGFTDSSKNNWTSNGISVTTGVTYDSMLDSPTDAVDSSGNINGSYCTLDSTFKGSTYIPTISNGALTAQAEGNSQNPAIGTLTVTSGKWYYEVYIDNQAYSPNIGWTEKGNLGTGDNWRSLNNTVVMNTFSGTGYVTVTSSNGSTGTQVSQISSASYAWTTGNTVMVALDADAKKVWFGKNGTWLTNSGVGNPGTGEFPTAQYPWNLPMTAAFDGSNVSSNKDKLTYNFGQTAFTYTLPTGFKALNTKNLKDVGSYNLPDTFGNFVNTPDLVWIKRRNSSSQHVLSDTVRGPNAELFSSSTSAQQSGTRQFLQEFNPNGFTLGASASGTGDVNINGSTYVGWNWNRGRVPGFDIVSYAGDGVNGRMIPHNLGVTPAFYITKCLTNYNNSNSFNDWSVYHQSCPTYTGNSRQGKQALWLHSILGAANGVGGFFTNASNTEFSPNQINYDNSSGQSYIAYLWAEVPGFSKFGGYTGNNSNDGPFVYLGFRPRFILLKKIGEASTTYGWQIYDTARSPINVDVANGLPGLWADTTAAEAPNTYAIDLVSNGFKIRTSNLNMNNTSTFVYAAFAESPFKYASAR